MKKGLFVLFSDNINLSLINLYNRMMNEGYKIDCYPVRKDSLSLHPFEAVDVSWLNEVSKSLLYDYDFIICGRNCFEYFSGEILVDYPGIIYTDDTAFYEGRNVYGDVVFVNGSSNVNNLKDNTYFEIFTVGCLKAFPYNTNRDSIWKNTGTYAQNVLFIESGHYPFGVKGRMELARSFTRAVMKNSDCLFVVKPRFLLGEAGIARHRNEDYLYFYVRDYFKNSWPPNLIWLDKYYLISELLPEADVVIHTYSSAHSEAAIMHKKILNIYDISSEETADFRANRFNQIRTIIDKAGNNISAKCLADSIKKAKEAAALYVKTIGGDCNDPAGIFIKIIKELQCSDFKCRKKRRLRGLFYEIISDLENRFDNYEYFADLTRKSFSYLDENLDDTEACITYMKRMKKDFAYRYIRERWNEICRNVFDRAYALRIFNENEDYESIENMLKMCYEENEEDATFYYFKAICFIHDKKLEEAKHYARKYIDHVNTLKYEKLDSENLEYLCEMEGVLNNEDSGVYPD